MKSIKCRMLLLLSMLMLAGGQVLALTTGELLQQGLYAEEIEGNLPEAIVHYEQIVNDASAPPNHIAQALYHQGVCYIRLSDEARAQTALTRLVNDFADQTAVVEKAKPLLAQIRTFDPAALMPPDTLVYLELGSPGEQIETILQMLKGTPLENPLEALTGTLSKDSPKIELNGVAVSLLNPVMLEEFKKIESFTIGIQGIQQPNPDFVGIINLGENNILRGLLLTTISVATRPGPVIGGVQTFVIPDNEGMIACDEKVYFIATSAEQMMWSIKQYTHQSNEASLATSNPSFKSMDKRVRQKNLATLWVDADSLFSQILPTDPSAENTFMPSPFMIMAAEGVDDLMLTASLATNAVTFDAQVNFKDGVPNPFYEQIRTPTLSKAGLSAVPSDAVALATLATPKANSALVQHFMLSLQDEGLGEPLNLLLENVQQISLFALPGAAEQPQGLTFRPGVVLNCKKVEPVLGAIQELLKQIPGVPPVIIVEADQHTILLSLEQSVELASYDAMKPGKSVLEKGRLSASLSRHLDTANKLVLVHPAGLIRREILSVFHLADDEAYNQQLEDALQQLSAVLDDTVLVVSTEEQPQQLALHAELTGIPPLSELLPSVISIQQVMDGIEQQSWERAAAQMEQQNQELVAALNENHTRLVQAFKDHDADAFADCWTDDAVCMIEELPMVRGTEALKAVFEDAAGAQMHDLERLNREIRISGDYAYETGIYVHHYSVPNNSAIQTDAMPFVTVWEKQPDASWKRCAEIWNARTNPDANQLAEWRAQSRPMVSYWNETVSGNSDLIIARLRGLERNFHNVFLSDNVAPAIDMYADDARLFESGLNWAVGKDQIRRQVMNGRAQATPTVIDCEVLTGGGNAEIAYVVNRFHWQFKIPSAEESVQDFYGKGLHVWRRLADGKWKILIDINNTNPPENE